MSETPLTRASEDAADKELAEAFLRLNPELARRVALLGLARQGEKARAEAAEAELRQLREERDAWKQKHIDSERDWRKEWLAREAAEAELERLREERDATMRSYDSSLRTLAKAVAAAEAAEAEVRQLREELGEMERDRDSWVDQCEDARRFEAKVHERVLRLTEGLLRLVRSPRSPCRGGRAGRGRGEVSGDRLAAIERDAKRPKIEGVHAQTHRLLPLADVLALVEVAKRARVMHDEAGGRMEGQAWLDLGAALARLDGGADEGDA